MDVGNYDTSLPLFIHIGNRAMGPFPPAGLGYQNRWTTFLGGNLEEYIIDNRLTTNNYLYVCGQTVNTIFPVIIGQGSFSFPLGGYDAFVVKFNPNRGIEWGIYYGGTGSDYADLVDVDAKTNDNVIFTGVTTSNALYACIGCLGFSQTKKGIVDLFVAKVNSKGLLKAADKSMSTFFGGDGMEFPSGLAISEYGNFYISGYTTADSYQTFPYINKPNAYFQKIYHNVGVPNKTNYGDGFIARFNEDNILVWSTAVGGYDNVSISQQNQEIIGGLVVDIKYNVFATGYTTNSGLHFNTKIDFVNSSGFFPVVQANPNEFSRTNSGNFDAVILKFDINNALVWSTEFGGQNDDNNLGVTIPISNNLITINKSDEIFIAGLTKSVNNGVNFPLFPIFPINSPTVYNQTILNNSISDEDGFVAKFSISNDIIWSSYLGGSHQETLTGIACGNTNKVFVTGYTRSANFPLKSSIGWYFQNSFSGISDGFVTVLNNSNLNYYYSSYFGGDLGSSIYSVDCRLETNANYTEEFVLSGVTGYNNFFPFANPLGTLDYSTTGINPNGLNGFISNITFDCPSCLRLTKDSVLSIRINNVLIGYELWFEQSEVFEYYELHDLLGRILDRKKINASSSLIISNEFIQNGITLLSLYNKSGNQTNIKLPIHE